ncbi:MAG: RNA ligase family protein [Verrucomicrobiota bacterium]
MITEFVGFSKMGRLKREIIVTEKIDGTNGCIYIGEDGEFLVGSRTRWITPENDNHGFARWAYGHKDELLKLGPGRHFGEWWGSGIQRGYGLVKGEKRFSLFNVQRWCLHDEEPRIIDTQDPRTEKFQEVLPSCVGLVPVLERGIGFDSELIANSMWNLENVGSKAAPGFMNPEGIVVFHTAGNVGFKMTIKNDDKPKGKGI